MAAGFGGALALAQLPSVKRNRELDAADVALRAGVDF